MSKYQDEHQHMRFAFSDHRSQLESLEQQFTKLSANLSEQLTDSSTRLSKYQKEFIPLKTLLDAYGRGNNLGAGNEPDMVDRELKEEQRRRGEED